MHKYGPPRKNRSDNADIERFSDKYEKNLYTDAAYKILRAYEERFANRETDIDSIMDGGTLFYHDEGGSNTEVTIIYGGYFFIEAILRLKGKSLFIW